MAEVEYVPIAGRYRWADSKRFVSRQTLLNIADQESQRLKVRLQGVTRLLLDNKIDLPQWQGRFADELKAAHLRVGMLAGGGQDQMTQAKYGSVGYQIKRQFDYLANFANDIAAGDMRPSRILARAGLYSESVNATFNRVEQITRSDEGFTEALRSLDSQARHCPSCISYSTQGQWLPVEQVTPPAIACECQARCRCSIRYRKRPVNLNQEGILGVA